jgi:hypothetical protein
MGTSIKELEILLALRGRARGPLNDLWEMREAIRRREAERKAQRVAVASLAKRITQESEPRITINIFLGDNHGD